MKPSLLYLSPEPPSDFSGGGISIKKCIKELEDSFKIYFLGLPLEFNVNLPLEGRDVSKEKFWIFKRDCKFRPWVLLKGWATRRPYKVTVNESRMLSCELSRLVGQIKFDVVVAEHSYMAEYAVKLPFPKVLNMHNIESALSLKEAEYSNNIAMKAIWKYEASLWQKWDKKIFSHFDRITVISQNDLELLEGVVGRERIKYVEVLERGVEIFPRDFNAVREMEMLFVGSMAYSPNIDAVLFFVLEILPKIRRVLPQATFKIVGANPVDKVKALMAIPGVSVTGFVPDVGPYYDRAEIVVIPMRSGGGVKMKLLEALGRGMPIVTTKNGAAGVNLKPGRDAFVYDDKDDFARGCIELLNNSNLRAEIGKNAQYFARNNHSWKTTGEKLKAIIEEAKRSYSYRRGLN